jgi:hypothetical protein
VAMRGLYTADDATAVAVTVAVAAPPAGLSGRCGIMTMYDSLGQIYRNKFGFGLVKVEK